MSELLITFNGKTETDLKETGVSISVNWDALLPTIGEYVRLRPDEIIDGLIVSDTDIRVKISRKRGGKMGLRGIVKLLNSQTLLTL